MAQPAMVIDHTLRQFIYFWHCGLQPSLTLETLENGEIVTSASVKSISAMKHIPLQPRDISRVKHCSGNNSRMKRRNKRYFQTFEKSRRKLIISQIFHSR